MSEVVVVGSLRARPGKEDELERSLAALVAPTHAEPGCILYALHRAQDDPARCAFVERWESRKHLDAHLGSAHVAELLERADELLAEPADIVVYDPRPLGEPRKGALAAAAS